MRTQILATIIVMGLSGLVGAEDAGALRPNNALGWKWRRASLPEATPVGAGGQTALDIKPFELSPIWVRLRKLVQEKSENNEHLLAQMTDEKLRELIASGGSFSPPESAPDPNAEGTAEGTPTPLEAAPRPAEPKPDEAEPAPKTTPPAADPNEGNTEKPKAPAAGAEKPKEEPKAK